jgi:translation initiation factor RLI1
MLIAARCPFEAIAIINLPTNLESQVTHRYTANAFKLHRLPTPRPGQVLGLVGTNGIGKSTALKILAGKLKPNLGRYDVSAQKPFIPLPCVNGVTVYRILLIGKTS